MPGGSQNSACLDEQAGRGLLEVLAGGQGIVADKVIACLARADRQSLGLACKALQDEVAARWRWLYFNEGLPAEALRSKLLPKLRGVEELTTTFRVLSDGGKLSALQDFYHLLLALKRIGARVKAIDLEIAPAAEGPLVLLPRRSARLAGQQPHDWVLTADSLRQLEPAPHLEWLTTRTPELLVDPVLLQPLLRTPALKTAQLFWVEYVIGLLDLKLLDFSTCTQLQSLFLTVDPDDRSIMDLSVSLQGLQPAPCLKKLELEKFLVDSRSPQHISSSLPALQTIVLEDCELAEPADASAGQELLQPSLPGLKRLELMWTSRWSQNITMPSDMALQQLLCAATSLKQLHLGFPGSTMPHLPLDSPGLAQLEELDIKIGDGEDENLYEKDEALLIIVEGDLFRRLAKYQRHLRALKIHIYGACPSLPLHPEQTTTEDVQAFLDAAPPGLERLEMLGFEHVQPEQLVRPAAACDLEVGIDGECFCIK